VSDVAAVWLVRLLFACWWAFFAGAYAAAALSEWFNRRGSRS
jgi:hypothetical protein